MERLNPIGIMQGRLLPPVGGRIQSFPVATWREEFALARTAGLACIEWIYETGTDAANPLATDEGCSEILGCVDETGVAVRSVCADYYMTKRLVDKGGVPQKEIVDHLKWLMRRASLLGVRYIVLPFVDFSSLGSAREIEGLVGTLRSVVADAEKTNVELHLETDLPIQLLLPVLESVDHPRVCANYDIGNSASLGHDPVEELTLLSSRLGSVHVKDRIRGGHTVSLGTGAADFSACFRLICAAGFQGPFILQAAREDSLSEVELAVRNREFVEKHLLAVESCVA